MSSQICGKSLSIRVFIALAALVAAANCFGQFETSAVLGTVIDKNGSAVPRAQVQLQNLGTGTFQNAVAGADGAYQFLEVRVGRYRVTAEAEGFKKTETPEFRVEVGTRLRVDAALVVGD